MKPAVDIKLKLSSDKIKWKDLSEFMIGLEVFNNSDELIYFDISVSELLVNSKRSFAWDITVQNGTIMNHRILPGNSKLIQWPLGNALFDHKGKYNLEFHIGDIVRKKEIIVSE